MSHASENPVYCARRDDLNCPASHPGSRWDAVKADKAGWFHSRAEEKAYCPDHVPDWVPAWREKKARTLHKVQKSYSNLPAELKCGGCDLSRVQFADTTEDPDALAELREEARQHARETGHPVTVTTIRQLTVEAVDA